MKAITLLVLLSMCADASAATPDRPNGFLTRQGRDVFPIGSYELPKDDGELKALAGAGFNLVHCHDKSDLDRAEAAGLMGWVSLPLQLGAENDALRKAVDAVKDHPALAVWEGPDEIVWNFTAYSGLHRNGVYPSPDEWWKQTPLAVERSESEAAKILPKLREGCRLVRQWDHGRHPIWVNEAAESDLKFIRQYLDAVDITGCDIYPIHENNRRPFAVGDFADRYRRIARGKPVWMVLQGFSWHQVTPPKDEHLVYPSFAETRFMAYDAIARGARGLLYWGTVMVPKESPFRLSLLALTSELSALQDFLAAPEQADVRVSLIESKGRALEGSRGVRVVARRSGRDWLVALVNEDDHAHMGVEVTGLRALNGKSLDLLYGSDKTAVQRGGFITRLLPHEVKVFASSRKWESLRRGGRDFLESSF